MKKMLAGGLALGFVGVGTALVAAPGGAQDAEVPEVTIETLDATLTPTTVAGGGTVTVTSVDPCPADVVGIELTQVVWGYNTPGWFDAEDPVVIDQGVAPLNEDGSWTVTFQATTAPGTYDLFAMCWSPVFDEEAVEGTEAEVLAEAATDGDGDEGGEHCPEPVEPQTLDDDEGHGDEGDCPEPCPPADVTPQGGDGSTSTTTCPTTPPSSDTTEPPPPEITASVYGPLTFTVTPGAAPVEGPPKVTG